MLFRSVKYTSVDAIFVLLEQTIGEIEPSNAARRKILTIKQGQKDTASHLIDWYEVAQKAELSNDALINHLYNSLHPTIVTHLQNCVMLRQELPMDLTSFLIEARHIDAVLRSSDPQYTKAPNVLSILSREMIDSSVSKSTQFAIWSPTDTENHRISRHDKERSAKPKYCFENKLCSLCFDPSHHARICPKAHWNQDKRRYNNNKIFDQDEISSVPNLFRNQAPNEEQQRTKPKTREEEQVSLHNSKEVTQILSVTV